MSLQEEVAALRNAMVHMLHHGLPKSEAQASEIAATLQPKEEEKTSTRSTRT